MLDSSICEGTHQSVFNSAKVGDTVDHFAKELILLKSSFCLILFAASKDKVTINNVREAHVVSIAIT